MSDDLPAALTRVRLTDFRSYESAGLDLPPRSVVLTGDNGAGKTNFLEALTLLAPGRGLRGAGLGELARQTGPGGWTVSGTLVRDGLADTKIGSAGEADPQGGMRRVLRLDGRKPDNQAELGRILRLVWVTPAMDRLFTDSPSARRRFLDRMVFAFDPDHGSRVTAYEKAMRDRNRLLKEGAGDPQWLAALESQMAEHGIAIAAARAEAGLRLAQGLTEVAAPFPRAQATLSGDWEQAVLDGQAAVDLEHRLGESLAASRRADRAAGRALVGPHLTDLSVFYAEKAVPAARGSTGEQKALLLSLILAHAALVAREWGTPPILLLDEVAAHLDEGRRAALYRAIEALEAQAFMTGTDAGLFDYWRGRGVLVSVTPGHLTIKS